MEFTRPWDCKADGQRYFVELDERWETIHYTAEEFVAQGDRVVMIGSCSWRCRSNGAVVDTPKADSLRMKEGEIIELYEFSDSAQALAAAR